MARLTEYQKDCISKALVYYKLVPWKNANHKDWSKKPGMVCNIMEQFQRSGLPLRLFAEKLGVHKSLIAYFSQGKDSNGKMWLELHKQMLDFGVSIRKPSKSVYSEIQKIIKKEIAKKGTIEKSLLFNKMGNLEYSEKFIQSAVSNLIKKGEIVEGPMNGNCGLRGYFMKTKTSPSPTLEGVVGKIMKTKKVTDSEQAAMDAFRVLSTKEFSSSDLESVIKKGNKEHGVQFGTTFRTLLQRDVLNGDIVISNLYTPNNVLKQKLHKLGMKVPSLVDSKKSLRENIEILRKKWKLSSSKAVENQIDSLLLLI